MTKSNCLTLDSRLRGNDKSAKKCLVLGLGSVLRADDGIGEAVIERLSKKKIPGNPTFLAKDISGPDILKYFPLYSRIIIIDAAMMNKRPGTVAVFYAGISKGGKKSFSVLPLPDKISFTSSSHSQDLFSVFNAAKKLGFDSEVYLVCVQAKSLDFSPGLAPEVRKSIASASLKVLSLIKLKNSVV